MVSDSELMSRRSITRSSSVSSCPAATGAAVTATFALTLARTMYSYRQPGTSRHWTAKRMRAALRVSTGSTDSGCLHGGAARGLTTVMANSGSASPEASACRSSWARAAASSVPATPGAAACAAPAINSNNKEAQRISGMDNTLTMVARGANRPALAVHSNKFKLQFTQRRSVQ